MYYLKEAVVAAFEHRQTSLACLPAHHPTQPRIRPPHPRPLDNL